MLFSIPATPEMAEPTVATTRNTPYQKSTTSSGKMMQLSSTGSRK